MLQAQSYSTVLDLAFMLPLNEQVQLVQNLQANIENEQLDEYGLTPEQRKVVEQYLVNRVEQAHERIEQGHYYTHEQAKQIFNERINRLKKAAV